MYYYTDKGEENEGNEDKYKTQGSQAISEWQYIRRNSTAFQLKFA